MKCKKHESSIPCMKCNQETYDRCMLENNQNLGVKDYKPHDLTQLAIILGIKIQSPSNQVTILSESSEDLSTVIKETEKKRFG